jgi:hypothetical protein
VRIEAGKAWRYPGKPRNVTFGVLGKHAEIWTEYHPGTSLEGYHYTSLQGYRKWCVNIMTVSHLKWRTAKPQHVV